MYRAYCLLLIFFSCIQVNAFQLKKKSAPIEIEIEIEVNKIYDINTVNETYIVDGYLVANWVDSTLEKLDETIVYENQLAEAKIGNGLWVPAFEFINAIGDRDISNKRIILNSKSRITYNERFRAVFSTAMDFKNFPFDTQTFTIQLEAFSYDETKLFFTNSITNKDWKVEGMSEEWNVLDKKKYVSSTEYEHLDKDKKTVFSRYNLEFRAERKPNYYIWQFILPLFLIIIVSWSVFWLPGFSDKLGTLFTLLLTVVAFNFHTSLILPKLPYKTFIESLITLSYLVIFVSLLLVIYGNHYTKNNERLSFSRLMNISKYLVPVVFILLVVFQYYLSFN